MENEAKIERIKTLMENFGVTQSEFAKRISIDASNFSKHLTGKLPVSDSLINRIVADLGVSKEWLCTGKGYMFRPSDNDAHSHIRTLTLPSEAIIPEARNGAKVYGLDVTAGNLARDRMFTEDLVIGSIDVPFINPDCSIVKVSGDSMKPVINNGDMIAIREIKNPQLIFWGQIYVILLEDYRMVKYIRKHDNPDRVILRSENKEYDDIEIEKKRNLRSVHCRKHYTHRQPHLMTTIYIARPQYIHENYVNIGRNNHRHVPRGLRHLVDTYGRIQLH